MLSDKTARIIPTMATITVNGRHITPTPGDITGLWPANGRQSIDQATYSAAVLTDCGAFYLLVCESDYRSHHVPPPPFWHENRCVPAVPQNFLNFSSTIRSSVPHFPHCRHTPKTRAASLKDPQSPSACFHFVSFTLAHTHRIINRTPKKSPRFRGLKSTWRILTS